MTPDKEQQAGKTASKDLRPRQSKKSSTSSDSDSRQGDAIAQLMEMMAPLLEFHRSARDVEEDDVELIWDIRVISGPSGKKFAHLHGGSSLSRALSDSMRAELPAALEREVVDKIARPLVSLAQEAIKKVTVQRATAGQLSDRAIDADVEYEFDQEGLDDDDDDDDDEGMREARRAQAAEDVSVRVVGSKSRRG
jgi:chaperone required for assembly of F1-ATPase